MSAIKNNLDRFPDTQAFDQGESFGRHAARRELLPLLKAALSQIETSAEWHLAWKGYHFTGPLFINQLAEVIADIERPYTPPVTTTPTDDESVNF